MLTRPGSLSTLEARGGGIGVDGAGEGGRRGHRCGADEAGGCHLVSMRFQMDMRMEVSVKDRIGDGVFTYGRRGAATDKLEYDVGNTSDHSESPAHLTTRRGEGVREG